MNGEWKGPPDQHTAEVSRWKVRKPDLILLTRMMTVRRENQNCFERYLLRKN